MHIMHKMYLGRYIKLELYLGLFLLMTNKIKKQKITIFAVMNLLADL